MDKEKIAKYFYTITLIISLIVFIFGRNLIGSAEDLGEENHARYSNLIYFLVFGFFLPLGVLVRELLMREEFKANKKVMIIKVIVFVLVLAIGLTLFFLLPTANVSQLILYLSYGSLIFIIVPSNAYNRKKQD